MVGSARPVNGRAMRDVARLRGLTRQPHRWPFHRRPMLPQAGARHAAVPDTPLETSFIAESSNLPLAPWKGGGGGSQASAFLRTAQLCAIRTPPSGGGRGGWSQRHRIVGNAGKTPAPRRARRLHRSVVRHQNPPSGGGMVATRAPWRTMNADDRSSSPDENRYAISND